MLPSLASSAADALAQLLFPAECLLCRALLPFDSSRDLVCPLCRHRWRPVVPPWCERCGQPEPLFGRCRVCADWPAPLQCARSAVWLDVAARRSVHALKYGGLPRIADHLAAAAARVTLPLPAGRAAALVPVPLGPRRLRARGYNQSALLAHGLGTRWGLPVAELLVRTRETATQTALTPGSRLANVAGAFEVRNAEVGTRSGSAFPLPRSTFVLVDDVFTTGATVAAAAGALEAAGARSIMAVTFGRATIPDFTS